MFKQLYHYGHEANTHDVTKAIAVITMVIDHVGWVTNQEWMRVIGRIAAPLFFFLVGYSKVYRWQNKLFYYAFALCAFHAFFLLPTIYINILFVFIIIRLLLLWLAPVKLDRQCLLGLFLFCNVVSYYTYSYVEYSLIGLEIALAGLFIRENRTYAIPWTIASFASFGYAQIVSFGFFQAYYFYPTIIIFIALGWWCCFYQQRIWSLPSWVKVPTLFLSRYSLPIYFYHLIGLILLYNLVHSNVI